MREKHWYTLHVFSNNENYVKKKLEDKIKQDNLEDLFGEILIPTEEIVEMRNGKRRKIEKKLYPGYVFVNMAMTENTWDLVRHTEKVLAFVGGTTDKPNPLPTSEMKAILNKIEATTDAPRLKVSFELGEAVRIIEGPFKDFNASVQEVIYEKGRLRVEVTVFGRATPVELEFNQVEKI